MKMKIDVKIWNIRPAFQDNRGSIYDILESDRIKHVGILISETGSIRANHYHKKSTQWTHIIEGKIIIYIKNNNKKDSKVKKILMRPGDMIEIPPLIIHAIKTLEKSKMLVLTDHPRVNNGYEYDTFRVKIL